MLWRRLLGSAAVFVGAAAAGCESAPGLKTGALGVPPPGLVRSGTDNASIRLQKPDTVRPAELPPLGAAPAARPELVAVIRATVNGVPILDNEVREAAIGPLSALARVSTSDRSREEEKILDAVLEQLIDRELLYQDAMAKLKKTGKKDLVDKLREAADKEFDRWLRTSRTGFKSDEEFKQYLLSMNTSLEGQKRLRERMFIAEEYLRSVIMRHVERAGGHQEVLDYYRSHPEEFMRPDSVRWQDIFVKASKFPSREEACRFAETLAARARTGEDFARLCAQYDDGIASSQQAAGIGTRRGDIRPPEAEDILFQLAEGQVGPVIEIPTGFHVIRLVKREYAGLMPFDARVQSQIRDRLKNEVYAREKKRLLDELRRNAQVEKYKLPTAR